MRQSRILSWWLVAASVFTIMAAALVPSPATAGQRCDKCAAVKGRIDTLSIPNVNLSSAEAVNIALPAGYFAPGDTTSYPVLYLLNGHGGNNNTWGNLIPLDSVATAYRMIIVCPDGRNSWYLNSPVVPEMQMEGFMADELIPYIDSNYRTRADRSGRAITGLSMGGHGGLWTAIRHRGLFGSAGSTSGGVDFTPFPDRWNINTYLGPYAEQSDRWADYTVMSQLDKLREGDLNIIFDCGTEDFFYEVNNKLDAELTRRGITHTYLTSPGIHNGEYWSKSIYPQLDFFYRAFYGEDKK